MFSQYFLLYFAITGLYALLKCMYNIEHPEKWDDEMEYYIRMIRHQISAQELMLYLGIIALLFGWILVPISIIRKLTGEK